MVLSYLTIIVLERPHALDFMRLINLIKKLDERSYVFILITMIYINKT